MNMILQIFLSPYKWYRRLSGGTWYRVVTDEGSGFSGPIVGWRRRPAGADDRLVDTEVYPLSAT